MPSIHHTQQYVSDSNTGRMFSEPIEENALRKNPRNSRFIDTHAPQRLDVIIDRSLSNFSQTSSSSVPFFDVLPGECFNDRWLS